MNLANFQTLKGVPLDDTLFNELARMYSADAYNAVGGAAYLTDVNNGQVTRRLWKVFGPRGLGWGLDVPDVVNGVAGDQHTAIIPNANFWYAYTDGEETHRAYISTAGAASNRDAGYAVTGAMTSCIKKAISYLGHQNALYCGLVDHTTVGHLIEQSGTDFAFISDNYIDKGE